MARSMPRAAALVVAFAGIVLNFLAAAQLITLWLNFRWESESEWEWLSDRWRIDGVKLMGGIFCVYSAFAGAVSVVGLAGVIKNKPSLVRFFRDFYIADFSFCTSFAIIVVYAAFHTTTRTGICEEFSRHPELMRDMQEMGMNIENCELWLSRAALAIAAVMFTVVVIRLHFLLAVSTYYTGLVRSCRHCCAPSRDVTSHPRSHTRSDSTRIYLLPASSEDASELVYAPVPMNRLSLDMRSQAKEAWVSETMPADQTRKHYHYRRHSRSSSSTSKDIKTGSIFLPIQRGEGLLPAYNDDTQQAFVKA
ncbi:hypothetical protein AX14_001108 [Amanita brunnescens Koide BX004]|nr:hypothetical protein AX14_001108 [Amanita brunnescens Koide BX004]